MEAAPNGSMSAIMGLDYNIIDEICSIASQGENSHVQCANLNSPNQTVISGHDDAVLRAQDLCIDKGAKRAIKLKVSIASHSKLMMSAANEFQKTLEAVTFSMPDIKIIHNVSVDSSFSSKDTLISRGLKGYRPFLNIPKKTLLKVTNKVFSYYIDDPSNYNNQFLRIRVRNLLRNLEIDGFDKKKFDLTYCNLHSANETLKFYSDQNISNNTNYLTKNVKDTLVLNSKFFRQPNEIVLRSLSTLISKTNNKYYYPRGKSMLKKIFEIKGNSFKKTTFGGCIIERINNTTLIYSENIK